MEPLPSSLGSSNCAPSVVFSAPPTILDGRLLRRVEGAGYVRECIETPDGTLDSDIDRARVGVERAVSNSHGLEESAIRAYVWAMALNRAGWDALE